MDEERWTYEELDESGLNASTILGTNVRKHTFDPN